MKHFIRQRLREAIKPSEAHGTENSIKTIVDGKRNVGFISIIGSGLGSDDFWKLINKHKLKTLKVPSNSYQAYIVYNEDGENQAKELLDIAEKYGGYLSHKATPNDTRRIGQLLGYNELDVESFIRKNIKSQFCNVMSVDTYEQGIELLINYLGSPNENPLEWNKIEKPLSMWKEITIQIRKEIAEKGMSGDSEVDESDTWWSAIQSTFCK